MHKVLPLLREHLAQRVDSALWQPLLAQEALLGNLLEIVLYHQHACAALTEDALMEVSDYCQRKLVALSGEQATPEQGVGHPSLRGRFRLRSMRQPFPARNFMSRPAWAARRLHCSLTGFKVSEYLSFFCINNRAACWCAQKFGQLLNTRIHSRSCRAGNTNRNFRLPCLPLLS